MDAGLSVTLPFSLPFGMILAAWIVLTESISIVENLAGLGVTVPAWLGKLLRVTREKVGKD
jgi:phage-related holin